MAGISTFVLAGSVSSIHAKQFGPLTLVSILPEPILPPSLSPGLSSRCVRISTFRRSCEPNCCRLRTRIPICECDSIECLPTLFKTDQLGLLIYQRAARSSSLPRRCSFTSPPVPHLVASRPHSLFFLPSLSGHPRIHPSVPKRSKHSESSRPRRLHPSFDAFQRSRWKGGQRIEDQGWNSSLAS